MKKKIDYESKYFSQKKDKKNIQTYIVLGFLALIFFIIVLALFFLFGNKDETGKIRNEFEFRFNERTFERQNIYRTDNGEVNLKAILEQFA
ncbi:MAG: hypothetical protein WH035_07810, partial [Spirochaetota bacterium]